MILFIFNEQLNNLLDCWIFNFVLRNSRPQIYLPLIQNNIVKDFKSKNPIEKSQKKFLNMLGLQNYTITRIPIIIKMICPKCLHSYNTTTHLPLIDKTGKTQCKQCSSKITPFSKNKQLSLNKELVKIMGKCPEHLDTQLSLYDVNSRKRRCPKCVIFCSNKDKFKDSQFVEIDGDKNDINLVMRREAQKTASKIHSINQRIVLTAVQAKEQAKQSILLNIQQRYRQLLSQLTQLYETERRQVNNKFQQIWLSHWQQSLTQFTNIQNKCESCLKLSENELKTEDKYEQISQNVKLFKEAQKIEESLAIRCQLVIKEIKNYQCQFKSGLRAKFEKQVQEPKQIKPMKKEDSIKQQFLIDPPALQFLQVTYMQILPSKCNISQCTQRSERASESASDDNLSVTSTLSRKPIDKSILVAKNIQDINKIETHIKEIDARNLQIGNTQAKKLLNIVNKSFARGFDLSGNKLTGIFLKDLNKTNIGKYLKWIKLKGNPIDLKDAAIGRKIEQLKGQGVNIIF